MAIDPENALFRHAGKDICLLRDYLSLYCIFAGQEPGQAHDRATSSPQEYAELFSGPAHRPLAGCHFNDGAYD